MDAQLAPKRLRQGHLEVQSAKSERLLATVTALINEQLAIGEFSVLLNGLHVHASKLLLPQGLHLVVADSDYSQRHSLEARHDVENPLRRDGRLSRLQHADLNSFRFVK